LGAERLNAPRLVALKTHAHVWTNGPERELSLEQHRIEKMEISRMSGNFAPVDPGRRCTAGDAKMAPVKFADPEPLRERALGQRSATATRAGD
jgi:hypothetical protein